MRENTTIKAWIELHTCRINCLVEEIEFNCNEILKLVDEAQDLSNDQKEQSNGQQSTKQ